MIPRVAQRGHSFKGAGAYYLHDKEAATSERVLWTETHNLPTNDPEKAIRCMAWTDKHSEELKRESGVSLAGREQKAGNVYSYSLAWHTEQQPDKDTMLKAANSTLGLLGLSEHEAVIVAHGDTAHSHVHVVVNLVHPDTGKVASIRQDQRQLSEWALGYEQNEGKIYCEEREENAKRREIGELTKYQDEKVIDAVNITALYQQSDSGKAFLMALEENGYLLANGDKGRLVLVDSTGNIQNLVRQIDGVKRKEIEAKLGDVLENLPSVTEAMAQFQTVREEVPVMVAATQQPIVSQVTEEMTPLDSHEIRIKKHAQRYEQEDTGSESEFTQHGSAADEISLQPVQNVHLVGLAQHWEMVKQHVQRIAEWVRDKPREYLESWRSKYRENNEQEEDYRLHEHGHKQIRTPQDEHSRTELLR